MNIETWPIDRVIPYDKNPRKNDPAVGPVAKSLAQFGWRQPIVVDTDGVIVVGHTRLKAAIAAEQTGRRAFLMELDLQYCDVIVARYEQFTGKKAERVTAAAVA